MKLAAAADEIRAPFDGYVEKRLVNLGELVKTQTAATARAAQPVELRQITSMAPWIKYGQPATYGRCVSGQDLRGQGLAYQSCRKCGDACLSVRGARAEADTMLKPGTLLVCTSKAESRCCCDPACTWRCMVLLCVVNGDKLAHASWPLASAWATGLRLSWVLKAGERVAVTDVARRWP